MLGIAVVAVLALAAVLLGAVLVGAGVILGVWCNSQGERQESAEQRQILPFADADRPNLDIAPGAAHVGLAPAPGVEVMAADAGRYL